MSRQSTTAPTRREGSATKRMMLVSGGAHPALADHLDTTVAPRTAHVFANGETFVRFEKSLCGRDVLQAPGPGPARLWSRCSVSRSLTAVTCRAPREE